MIPHNHIDQQTRLPEDCPACKKLWEAIASSQFSAVYDELAQARKLRDEYGEDEMLEYLTDTRDKLLRAKGFPRYVPVDESLY